MSSFRINQVISVKIKIPVRLGSCQNSHFKQLIKVLIWRSSSCHLAVSNINDSYIPVFEIYINIKPSGLSHGHLNNIHSGLVHSLHPQLLNILSLLFQITQHLKVFLYLEVQVKILGIIIYWLFSVLPLSHKSSYTHNFKYLSDTPSPSCCNMVNTGSFMSQT